VRGGPAPDRPEKIPPVAIDERTGPTPVADDDHVARDNLQRWVHDPKRLALSIVLLILLGTGVVLLVGRAAGFAKLLTVLREAQPGWLVACLLLESLSVYGYVLAFRDTACMNDGPRFGLGTSTRIVLASLGATRLIAAAGAGGLAVNYWALRHAGLQRRETLVRVLGLNTVLYLVFGLLGMAGAAILLVRDEATPGIAVPWLVVVPACIVAAWWVGRPERAERLAADHPDAGWLRRGFSAAVAGVILARTAILQPRRYAGLAGGSLLYWLGDMATLYAGLRAFGVHTSAAQIALAYTTGYVANLLPLPTGGVGGVDAAMTYALHVLGVPLDSALAGVIAYRFFGFWLPTIPAAWAFFTLPSLGRTLEHEYPDHEPQPSAA